MERSFQAAGPAKGRLWDMKACGCLDCGEYCSITSDGVLKILWRDVKKKNS